MENDLISRKAAIDAIVNSPSRVQDENMPLTDKYDGATFRQIEILGIIDTLPSAEPKKGRWDVEHGVFMYDDIYGDIYHCSVCGYRERNPEGFNYCPNCGAKMEVEG